MEQIATELDGPVLIQPARFGDARGFFAETFRESTLGERSGSRPTSSRTTTRGRPAGCCGGCTSSPSRRRRSLCAARGARSSTCSSTSARLGTFGRWEAYRLDDENLRTLYAPVGFAHGFCVVSDVADVIYKQTAYWSADADRGFAPDDPEVGIEWPIPPERADAVRARPRCAAALREVAAVLRPA